MVVVFAEPMDTTVLRADAIMLYDALGHTPIPGSLAFVDSSHLAVGFRPLSPLAAAREYELVVTDVGRDLDGKSGNLGDAEREYVDAAGADRRSPGDHHQGQRSAVAAKPLTALEPDFPAVRITNRAGEQ